MAKFVQQDGETILLEELVTCIRNHKRVPNGRIFLTDRRVVLLAPREGVASKIVGFLLGRRIAEMMAGAVDHEDDQTHQIKRSDFAEVEQGDQKLLIFRNNGEGYAHLSFEVFSDMPFDAWKIRMQKWLDGTLPAST